MYSMSHRQLYQSDYLQQSLIVDVQFTGTIGVRGGIHSGPLMRKELESRLKVVEIKIGLRKVNIVLEVRSFPFTPA